MKEIQRTRKKIKMQQIVSAQWGGPDTASYSIIGLGIDGCVYRYDGKCGGWIPWDMRIAACADSHKR